MLHGTSLLRIIFKAINLHTYKSDGFFKVTRASTLLFLFRYIKGMKQVLLPGKRVQVRKKLPDQICNSPYCQPYNSYNVSSENLVLDNYLCQIDIFPLFSSLIWLILYWYCKEKFCLGHSWELKGQREWHQLNGMWIHANQNFNGTFEQNFTHLRVFNLLQWSIIKRDTQQ